MYSASRTALRHLRTTPLRPLRSCFATKATPEASSSKVTSPDTQDTKGPPTTKPKGTQETLLSSCAENTIMTGLNYLKDQPAVQALPDSEYPPWLWKLLQPKVYPDDGPGGKGEKMRLRKQNKQRIKEQNFLKTQ